MNSYGIAGQAATILPAAWTLLLAAVLLSPALRRRLGPTAFAFAYLSLPPALVFIAALISGHA